MTGVVGFIPDHARKVASFQKEAETLLLSNHELIKTQFSQRNDLMDEVYV